MREFNTPSEKKEKQLLEFKNSPIQVGEIIYLSDELCKSSYSFRKSEAYKVLSIDGDNLTISINGYSGKQKEHIISINDVGGRFGIWNVGADPFTRTYSKIRPVAYQLESIVFGLDLVEKRREKPYLFNGIEANEVNWNPFVYDEKGNKQYYQRDFVWTINEEQLLIDSIYKDVSCGSILIRKRSWEELEKMAANGETELAFNDIVDGKQRLNTIRKFLNNEITDSYGNYFMDLSNHAQNDFLSHQLFTYAEMESATDDDVLYQFLKLNFSGIPQSKEHIDYVTNLLKLMQK